MGEKVTKIKGFWNSFLDKNSDINRETKYDYWSFGDTEELVNNLLKLVLEGKKTGTSSLDDAYKEGDLKPQEGSCSIVTDFSGNPKCVIKIIKVKTLKFKDVTEEMAALEGEGDLSLKYWRDVHIEFFNRSYYKDTDEKFTEDKLIIFEEFKVVYRG